MILTVILQKQLISTYFNEIIKNSPQKNCNLHFKFRIFAKQKLNIHTYVKKTVILSLPTCFYQWSMLRS